MKGTGWQGLAACAAVGAVLRLWGWSSQVLLDDEWHALNFVLGRTLPEVFFQQGVGANSIPVNLHTWLLLHTVGWSEPLLRLPSLAAGIAALFVLPLLVKRIWGPRAALLAAAMLAVSPVAIFYSRIARPYAPAMLLAAASVLLTLAWLKEGRRRDLLLSAICGSFSIWYHLYAAIPVFVSLAVAVLAAVPALSRGLGLAAAAGRPGRDLLAAGGTLAVLAGVLVVVPNALHPWWAGGIHGMDRATWRTALTVLGLLAGTRLAILKGAVLLLALSGLVRIAWESRAVGLAFALPFAVFTLAMALTTQEGSDAGIQIARYGIAFFPLSFAAVGVAAARAGDFLQERVPILRRGGALFSLALAASFPFLATSPLLETYRPPNNFTHHSAFQYRYEARNWDRSPERDLSPGISIRKGEIPRFYSRTFVLDYAKGIVEYPMVVGDHLNLYFYYQHFHRRPVVAGYRSDRLFERNPPGGDWVYGDFPIDYVLGEVPAPLRRRFSWRTMVDLGDIARLRAQFEGWLIVVHKNPLREALRDKAPAFPWNDRVGADLSGAFGAPLFEDGDLVVWGVH